MARKAIGVTLIQDLSRLSSPVDGFLRRHRHRIKTLFDDGSRSDVYVADYADRAVGRRDAAAVVAYSPSPTIGDTWVLLRRQLRYPVHLMTGQPLCLELPAGLIEGKEAPKEAAARELVEETAVMVPLSRIQPLGPAFFPSPGILTEQIFLFSVAMELDTLQSATKNVAEGDGSPMEEGAEILVVQLKDAMAEMVDAKTELGLRRLWAHLAGDP